MKYKRLCPRCKKYFFPNELTKIGYCKECSISPNKCKLINELGSNWYDDRFNTETFIKPAIEFSLMEWNKYNLGLTELWKQVAIESAKHSETPFNIANNTIDAFKKQFKLNN